MKIKTLVAARVLCAAGNALAQDVTYNAMPGVDFSKLKTYKWVKIDGAVQPEQILATQIPTTVDAELAAKGLTKSEADTADLYVGYQVSVNQENSYASLGVVPLAAPDEQRAPARVVEPPAVSAPALGCGLAARLEQRANQQLAERALDSSRAPGGPGRAGATRRGGSAAK